MSYNRYAEGKYSCNHPESDFVDNSTDPIEMKRENFTEYTKRNETSNIQYDVWSGSNNTARLYRNNGEYSSRTQYSGNSQNSTKKSSGGLTVFIIIFIIYGLPMLLGLLFQILEDFS